MKKFDYLIVGGGMAAYATAKGIRDVDTVGRVAMVSEEGTEPYNRTALSKSLWKGGEEDDIRYPLEELDVDLIAGRAHLIEPEGSTVRLEAGDPLEFGKLMLATGVRHRRLPLIGADIHYLRNLADYRALRAVAVPGRSFLVIGGGFLGAELASSLAGVHCRVAMVFPEQGVNARILPTPLSTHLNGYFRERGVEILPGRTVDAVERTTAGRTRALLSDGTIREFDEVVAAIGAAPRSELAEAAGLEMADGIAVDEHFRTSHPAVYATGDVASFPDRIFGRRRVEHEDHAMHGGELAGHVMAGELESYDRIPLFYSDLFDLGYEAVGILDPSMRTAEQWEEPYRKGVVYYRDEDSRVKGVLLWNSRGLADKARELIVEGRPVDIGLEPVLR